MKGFGYVIQRMNVISFLCPIYPATYNPFMGFFIVSTHQYIFIHDYAQISCKPLVHRRLHWHSITLLQLRWRLEPLLFAQALGLYSYASRVQPTHQVSTMTSQYPCFDSVEVGVF